MKTSIILCWLFLSIELLGQTNDSTYQKYLNNNKYVPKRVYYKTDSPEIIKTEIAEILDGNIPIIWEHRFADYLGIDGGIGLIMPYSFVDYFKNNYDYHIIPEMFCLNNQFINRKFGFSIHVEPKLYLPRNKLFIGQSTTSFISLIYNIKSYKNLNVNKLGVGYGYTIDFNKISFQVETSLSYLMQSGYKNISDIKYLSLFNTSTDYNPSTDYTRHLSFLRLDFIVQIGYIMGSSHKKN